MPRLKRRDDRDDVGAWIDRSPQRSIVLRLIRAAGRDGLTRAELAEWNGLRIQSVCLRVHELKRRGLVAIAGRRHDRATDAERNEVLVAVEHLPDHLSLERWAR